MGGSEADTWARLGVSLDADWRLWTLLGEARSRCLELAGTPLPPALTTDLAKLHRARGAHASAALAGGTLTEAQAVAAVSGRLRVPESHRPMARELQNLLDACGAIEREGAAELTPTRLLDLNRRVLAGLEEQPVELLRDRRAPIADACDRLAGPLLTADADPRERFVMVFARAVLAHLHVAAIRPFANGNLRTARLAEFAVLASARLAFAGHLLWTHYLQTRREYERAIAGGDVGGFLVYAATGLTSQLEGEVDRARRITSSMAWRSHVEDAFRGEDTAAPRRQRMLVMALPQSEWVARRDVPDLSPALARAYAGRGPKTLSRDVNSLVARDLIEKRGHRIRTRREVLYGLLPAMRESGAE